MSRAATESETEELRRRLLAEADADHGPGWAERYRPGTFGCHELLDRTHVVASQLEQFVLAHPACLSNPEWFALAEQAADALRRLYQAVGAEH